MIRAEQMAVKAGTFHLRGIDFEIPTGQYGVLMGKTGSGKTTILEAVCGLRRVSAGSLRLMDRVVTNLKPAERGIGYVPQDRALFQTMTVREHLAFALEIRQWSRPAIDQRVEELSQMLGIHHLLSRKPPGLSGGEGQRVALGRALSAHPNVLCLDEPLSALDDETREEMCALLELVQARTGVTTLHVTHHLGEAERLADKILILQQGRIVEQPNPAKRQH